jgi:D-alanyl-D-alanine carboxypeptidase
MSAQAYLIGDFETGEIILVKNDGFTSPIASVSKLMTGVVARENMSAQQFATVSRDSYNTYGAQGELTLGEKIRVGELMYPLLIESSNDGAEVIADEYGREKFMELMNKKAIELDMQATYYEDPSGLSPRNVSTVGDLFKLIRYIREQHPEIFDITRVRQYSINKHQWINQNRLAQYASFIGGKNGYIDEARQTTASVFNTELKKGKRQIVIVILKSNDRNGDVAKLLNYLKKYIEFIPA